HNHAVLEEISTTRSYSCTVRPRRAPGSQQRIVTCNPNLPSCPCEGSLLLRHQGSGQKEFADSQLVNYNKLMRFLRKHQYVLCFLAVLVFSSVMVVRQFIANQSAHVELREDFIFLHERAETKPQERLYQMLVQQLPALNEKALVEDLQRTAMLVDPKTPQ